jgi:dTDP-4-amino-4,6-dideoxygalactose transaminase
LFYLLMPSLDARTALIEHLKENQILAVFHYQPLHLSTMGLRYGGKPGLCPVTERVADRLVRLPLYVSMSDEDQGHVVESVTGFTFR